MIRAILMTAAMLMVVLKILQDHSAEEEKLYSSRFENGYDLYDPRNTQWLSVHHPIAACIRSNEQTTNLLTTPIVMPVQVDLQPSRKVRTLELQIIL